MGIVLVSFPGLLPQLTFNLLCVSFWVLGQIELMHKFDLQTEILGFEGLFKSFEKLLKTSERLYKDANHMAYASCELYAMIGAYKVRASIGATEGSEIAPRQETTGYCYSSAPSELPKYEDVKNAGQGLLAAMAAHDRAAVSSALEKMGVLTLCPIMESQFLRMELAAGRMMGRAQLIPLVEL